jgi:trans-aconitate methyltransferase
MTSAATTIDYYEVFEAALSSLTAVRGEYRRHFGAQVIPSPPGYCWFKGVTDPERHPEFTTWLCDAGTVLETELLARMAALRPKSALDVGCGNGALLRRVAREYPGVALTGINSQPTQVRTARSLLTSSKVQVIEADFFAHDFGRKFELAFFFESAFHMPDKPALCRRLAEVIAPGGEVWLIDIVVAERAADAFSNVGTGALFNYVPRKQWQTSFSGSGFEEAEYRDFSHGAAEVLQVSDIKLLTSHYFTPRLRQALSVDAPVSEEKLNGAVAMMVQIATEYRRLSRLLRGGMLQYVLMRYRKAA